MSLKNMPGNLRIILMGACCAAMIGGLGVTRARADSWDKKTVMTIREPVQVRNTLLQPGTYVFKLLDSNSDRHIVQIFNEDQTRIIDTELAIPNYRLQPTGQTRFGFWETPPGYAKALRAWFYPGDNFGQEFPYPKHLSAVETASVTVTHEPMPAAEEPAAAAPAPQPVAPAPQPQEEARMTPPATLEPAPAPAPEAAAPAPEAAPAPAPQATTPEQPALPKTATNYPAVGLAGLCCLALFGFVRKPQTEADRKTMK